MMNEDKGPCHTCPTCLVLMRAELAVMRYNAARWRWGRHYWLRGRFCGTLLLWRVRSESSYTIHGGSSIYNLDIWYLLYSISMQSCADYLDSFHGCIRICLLDSGQSCLAVSHCSSALGWCLKRPQIAHIQFGIDIAAVDFTVSIVTVQSWKSETWKVIKIETRCIFSSIFTVRSSKFLIIIDT